MRHLITDFCQKIGQQPLWVQGAGGNVSWKDDAVLWIKASGTQLADAQNQPIFVPVDLPPFQQALARGQFDATPHALDASGLRPSIETALHALMPHRVVVHVHMIDALALLVCAQAHSLIAQRLPADVPWVFVGYHKPGAALAQAVADGLTRQPDTDIVFLQNHGVVIGAESVEGIQRHMTLLTRVLAPDQIEHPPVTAVPAALPGYTPIADPSLHALVQHPLWLSHIQNHWVLYPDHAVFLGAYAHVVDDLDTVLTQTEPPSLVFVKGVGVYTNPEFNAAKLAQLQCYRDVVQRLPRDAAGHPLQLNPLSPECIGELLNWDAEKYRQQLAKR